MNFLEIPGEVITHHVLPNLQFGDLLRLRRVCKTTKGLATDYIRKHVRSSGPEVVIGLDPEEEAYFDTCDNRYITLGAVLESEVHLPTTRFYLLYEGNDKHTEMLMDFLEQYGNQITHLRVYRLVAPTVFQMQNDLYASLPKLTHLVIDQLVFSQLRFSGTARELEQFFNEAEAYMPGNFKNLTHLEVKEYLVAQDSHRSHKYLWKLVEFCDKLEYLGLPKFKADGAVERDVVQWPEGHVVTFPRNIPTFGTFCFNYLRTMLKVRKARTAKDGGTVTLKYLDIGNMEVVRLSTKPTTPSFAKLMTELVAHDVKLLNAKAEFLHHLDEMREAEEDAMDSMDDCVTSLHGLSVHWFKGRLPLLEKLTLQTSYTVTLIAPMTQQSWTEFPLPLWQGLKSLDLIVDSKYLVDTHSVKQTLFMFLFGIPRENLEELTLTFLPDDGMPEGDLTGIPVPSAANLTANCSNLRKLTITGWNGTNKALSELWMGLPKLEEITLEACAKLGNAAFVGEDSKNPTFLRLKDLKKLSLKSLDKMPKVTDTVFSLVFCHLTLREFHLTCSSKKIPLKSITRKGIKALLSGEFAVTIERFPFNHWALANVNEMEFRQLRDEFKCSQML